MTMDKRAALLAALQGLRKDSVRAQRTRAPELLIRIGLGPSQEAGDGDPCETCGEEGCEGHGDESGEMGEEYEEKTD